MKSKVRSSNLDLARRLRAAGILIDMPEDGPDVAPVPPEGLLISQTGSWITNMALEMEGGWAGFMVSLVITANLPSFAISHLALEVPWQDTVVLLEDPLEVDGTEVYRLDKRSGLEFPRAEVINHHANIQHIMPRGSSVEGLLLGFGLLGLPDGIRHGETIPAFVKVTDQYMSEYQSAVSVWADRSERLRVAAHPKPKRKGLLECPDPGYDHRSIEEHEGKAKK